MVSALDKPLDVIAPCGEGTLVGAFRCAITDPRFRDSGPIERDIFVFPRTSVGIRHAGGPSLVADPTVATLYNRGQVYDRSRISEEGDRSDWFAVPRAVAMEAVIANGYEPAARGPFPFALVPVADATYLRQRRLFRRAMRGADTEAIDEAIYAVLDDVLSAAAPRAARPEAVAPRSRAIADEIRSVISGRIDEGWSLSRLAAHFRISAFALSRAFRKATGSTIHRYLVTLRLRASLEHLERPRADLSAVALDLGFASHSHFSFAFSRTFAETPRACRRTFNGGGMTGQPG